MTEDCQDINTAVEGNSNHMVVLINCLIFYLVVFIGYDSLALRVSLWAHHPIATSTLVHRPGNSGGVGEIIARKHKCRTR